MPGPKPAQHTVLVGFRSTGARLRRNRKLAHPSRVVVSSKSTFDPQRQDVSDDLRPSQKVLGMSQIIRAPCRCLDRTEGHGYHFHHHHHSHLLGNSSLRHPNPVAGFNLPEGLCFQQRRCVVIVHRPTGGGSNGWPVNNDEHNNAREHASR